ncbi:MAG: LysM peptidoglycan-binding domain-containing protein [Zoogloeaceae bacterium]|nr:LysM peptidoglycan-binding domain-containing protein [Zoogloeaceae bacterium]
MTTHCLPNDRRQGDTPWSTGCGVVVSALFLVMALFAQLANAAGMEGIQVHSLLGQPLRAEINISASREEQGSMTARLANPEQFSQVGMSYSSEHATLRLSLEKRGERSIVVIHSTEPIYEPYLDLLVELNWQAGRLMRGYTVLLDPPEVASQILYQPIAAVPAASPPAVEAKPAEPAQPPVEQPQQIVQPAEPPQPAEQPQAVTETQPVEPPQSVAQQPVEEPPQPVDHSPQPAMQHQFATQPQHEGRSASGFAGAEYVVKKGDTLHRIATANQLPGVSLEQMLVALHRNNPNAFVGNNMNRLRQGAVLRLTNEMDASLITQPEAKQVIRTQTAAWNQYRRTLASYAGGTDATTSAGSRSVSGTVSARVDDKSQSADAGRDQVRVSRSNQSQGSVGVSEEDLIAQNKRLQESRDRVAALEKIVADLQKLLEMREQNLQDIKKQQNSSPAGGEQPRTGRSGRPTASLGMGSQAEGQVFSTIDAYKVAA